MLSDFIRFNFIYLNTILTCLNLSKYLPKKQSTKLAILSLCVLLAVISALLTLSLTSFTYIIPLLILLIITYKFMPLSRLAFSSIMISFGISYSSLGLTSFIILLILSPLFYNAPTFPFAIYALLSGVLQTILIMQLFKIKRFTKGMPFLFSSNISNIATIISLLILALLCCMPSEHLDYWWQGLVPYLFFICFIVIISWWQSQITKSYKQALLNRELESLRMELEEKEKQLHELSVRNEELGRLIHKDNKRIPAMEQAVSEFLIMDLDDKETVIEKGNTLLLEIQKLSADRNAIVTEIYARKYKHHDTGITELDTMLNYMEKRAYGEHIKLSVQTSVNLLEMVPNTISAEDLSHVLSDLLENAIIATKGYATPVIQLQFYRTGKDFILEIADNGTPFEATSLVNYGLEQITTHADTGGSGFGLMDIWKTKEKYSASLHISEYDANAPYTKKIALIFNKKNRYTISTTRKEELSALCKRTDLQIF